ncbi:MAG: MFS transporter [Bryobacterales bacterium]|nr:MFS transporter [Bryobacterales bacterium]
MRPTQVRYKVLGYTIVLGMVTYMDRVAISITSRDIQKELSLTDFQMSLVFSAFTLAYGMFEIPTGWWGDRVGTRRVLTRIVSWWSAFTIATAAAFNYHSLLAIRFLFGIGEAGAWPNVARTFSRWFPQSERGRAQGIFFTGAHFGAAFTPVVATWLLTLVHWRWVFVIFGSVGFLWALAWYRWFRDEPSEHAEVNEAERHHIESGRGPAGSHTMHGVPWGAIFSNRNVLLLCAAYFAQSYGFYFFLTWMPTYLARVRGFSAMNVGLFAGLPMVFCVLSDIFGGVAADWASRRFGLRVGRASVGITSYLCASLCMLAGTAAEEPRTAALLLALAAGWASFCLGAAWGTVLDISGANAGVVGGVMNTAGQIGGMLSPVILGYVVQNWSDWNYPLYLTGVLFLLGAFCWLFIDPRRPIGVHGPG